MKRAAFLTTVFPMEIVYLKEMLDSLIVQTNTDFDLVVVNDGLNSSSVIFNSYRENFDIIEIEGVSNVAKNREIGINYCIRKGYEFLVFGDSDDVLSRNRIEQCLEILKTADVVINDLSLFGADVLPQEKYLSNRLVNNQAITFEFIKDKNVFGLSNTAIKLGNISNIDLPENLIAVDWYFYSLLLLCGSKAIFTNDTVTYYRQYQGNTVGMSAMSELNYEKAWVTKRRHYAALQMVTDQVNLEYKKFLEDIPKYKVHKSKITHPLWWELA